ncbi:MAG: glycosyltransferase family 1 protein [Solirubrobacteraceae bacterium]|nr:glycosyltransferase family 1 protein [Solirubrobacteraceae bacterium]
MRILFTSAPFHGHLNPLLPLATAAQQAGHQVVVATGADLAEHALRIGLPAWSVGPTNRQSGMPRSLDEFWEAATLRAAGLLPLVEVWDPDLVVAEEMELAGPIVAARTGARLVVHGLGIQAAGDPTAYADDLDALGRRWAVPDLARRHRDALYLQICPPSLAPPEGARPATELVRPAMGRPLPGERLPESLDALPYAVTVHLTLGTVFHRRRPEAMADALAALQGLPVNVVAAVGPDVAPDSFGPQPAHVLLARYLPHSLLLPRCDLVVSQGGAGILLGALAHGLPQLVLPQGADQFGNGAAVERAGAGLTLDDPDVAVGKITDAVRTLLDTPGYGRAARAVAEEIAVMPTADDVIRKIG